ncbi:MAG: integral membrane protein [Bacteroidia bacterium]|jgi:integral membrane protein
MIKAFRITSYLEGISYLLLLGVGVPLKYLAGNDVIVKSLGMPHGILFMAYIFLAIIIKQKVTWDTKTMIIVLIASVIPFGTFYVDKKYLQ